MVHGSPRLSQHHELGMSYNLNMLTPMNMVVWPFPQLNHIKSTEWVNLIHLLNMVIVCHDHWMLVFQFFQGHVMGETLAFSGEKRHGSKPMGFSGHSDVGCGTERSWKVASALRLAWPKWPKWRVELTPRLSVALQKAAKIDLAFDTILCKQICGCNL